MPTQESSFITAQEVAKEFGKTDATYKFSVKSEIGERITYDLLSIRYDKSSKQYALEGTKSGNGVKKSKLAPATEKIKKTVTVLEPAEVKLANAEVKPEPEKTVSMYEFTQALSGNDIKNDKNLPDFINFIRSLTKDLTTEQKQSLAIDLLKEVQQSIFGSVQSEPKAETKKAEPAKAEPAKAEPKAETKKAEPAKAEPAKAEPKAETKKAEPKAETKKAEPAKAEPKAEKLPLNTKEGTRQRYLLIQELVNEKNDGKKIPELALKYGFKEGMTGQQVNIFNFIEEFKDQIKPAMKSGVANWTLLTNVVKEIKPVSKNLALKVATGKLELSEGLKQAKELRTAKA